MSDHPIADYALLSDCRGSALVRRDGSVDWLCLPRFDAPALLAGLLDPNGGHFRVGPAGAADIRRRYLPQSLVLETTFRTDTGQAVLRDALAAGADEHGHDLGRSAPHTLLRELRCTAGTTDIEVSFAPRPEYGLVQPLLRPVDGGVLARGGPAVLMLSTDASLAIEGASARARLRLRDGERLVFALEHRSTGAEPPRHWTPAQIIERIDDTIEAWRSWSRMHQRYEGPWASLVHHSGRVLQGLSYQPTHAVIAAPTTSLPETVGGGRNWDYRYTWVRDASLTLDALWVAACPDEAHWFFDFLAATALIQMREHGDLQIMFGIEGEHDLSERQLPHLAGWRNSAPVRVGNDAWRQRQLDVYGELLAAADRLRDQLTALDPPARRFLADAVQAAAERWQQKDQGIWEMRTEPRDYLHSKLMCWTALDRGIKLAELLEAEHRVPDWRHTRDHIRDAILTRGWSDAAGAFTQSFGSDVLDASSLMIPIMGLLPADDPRMCSTMDAIEQRLSDSRGFVYRYANEDGLEGAEGTFVLCTFWLAQARAMAGQVDRARALFERAAACVNDVGLLSEQIDPDSGEHLGNFPQAFSHIGLINAAWAIHTAEQRA
ncbi:MAG: glycoside hydrolase family 15 protein [Thiohalocapsa sp.]|nr:glycoside hydrolase family 15 protein [Thiohalocapsa sp.]MCF7989279.1 glycoside hydrolase family 15 protein [Thiohalocapsa sp.]